MILFFPVVLKELSEQGRNFPWPRLEQCPRCGSHCVWGHGYVRALFDGFNKPILLKLCRCPNCRCIIRLRPSGFFTRFQAPIAAIRESMAGKEESGRFLPGLSRTRQAHWWRALKRRIEAFFGNTFRGTMAEGFDRLLALGRTPVSRAI